MNKHGRAISVKEAQQVLETTATRTSLQSWFAPFASSMIDAIQNRSNTITLGGKVFAIRYYGDNTVFMVNDGTYCPMINTTVAELKSRVN